MAISSGVLAPMLRPIGPSGCGRVAARSLRLRSAALAAIGVGLSAPDRADVSRIGLERAKERWFIELRIVGQDHNAVVAVIGRLSICVLRPGHHQLVGGRESFACQQLGAGVDDHDAEPKLFSRTSPAPAPRGPRQNQQQAAAMERLEEELDRFGFGRVPE